MKLILIFSILISISACESVSRFIKRGHTHEQDLSIKGEGSVNIDEVPTPVIIEKKDLKLSEKLSHDSLTPKVNKYCHEIDQRFRKYNWDKSYCHTMKWNHVRNSTQGRPLFWQVFGENKKTDNVTMILCSVHGDEITPTKFCFDVIHNLTKEPLDLTSHTLIIAPIVNPDGFFKERPSRTNANGVDINRNMPTKDWNTQALSKWKNRYASAPRRYPGKKSLSEPETIFQVNLIKRYAPHKIISVHAPLTLLDYDGPRLAGKTTVSLGEKLLKTMSKKAYDYKIKNYPFFPGSLGNYAGNERQIPTYTLELPNSDYNRSQEFWNVFKDSIRDAITTDFRQSVSEKSLPESVESI